MFRSAAVLSLLMLSLAPAASAGMIEVGGGAMSALKSGDLRAFVHVSATRNGAGTPRDILYVLTVSADAEFSGDGLPYLNIDLVPVQGGLLGGFLGFEGIHTVVRRDIDIDQEASLRIDIFGIFANTDPDRKADEAGITSFFRIAADAIGYKMASHVSDQSTFHGVNALAIDFETGWYNRFSKGFVGRVSLGFQGDISIGGSGSFGVQSDDRFYAQVSADVANVVEFFVRAGAGATFDTGNDNTKFAARLNAGAIFHFE